MCNSSLEEVWKGTKLLKSLKILNLSHLRGLVKTPDFSKVTNLVNLILKDCINLVEVHESIGELRKLVSLNLEGCYNLRKLPINIDQLKSLEELVLSGCSKLCNFFTELGKKESLTVLKADRIAINALPSTTTEVKSWRSLFWPWALKPRESPESIRFSLTSLPRTLTMLSLGSCNLSDDAIPKAIGSLSFLRNLNLSFNPIRSLPESIKDLTVLESVNLNECRRLQCLPKLPRSLKSLYVRTCASLEKLTNLPNSLYLDTAACDKLVEVEGMFKLEPIGNYGAEMINKLGLFDLESMKNVEVELSNSMTNSASKFPLQGLHKFGIFNTFLPWREIPGCFRIKSIGSPVCFNLPSLPNIKIEGLNICVVYDLQAKAQYYNNFFIRISNKSNNLKWEHCPSVIGIPDYNQDMMWLSYWKIGNQLEGGDEVHVSVSLSFPHQPKEIGIHVVYEREERGSNTTMLSFLPMRKTPL